jgi:hypothetical protein
MPDDPSTQQALNPDLLGYPNVEALVAAKRASDVEAKRLYDENTKLNGIVAQVVTQGFPNGRQDVPDRRNGSASPEDRLTQFGVPVDALDEYVGGRITAGINKILAPLTNGVQARGRMVTEHPDYVQFENDVANFIANDPKLSETYPKMFEADPAGAMEYAFLKFGDSRRRAGPPSAVNGGGPPVTDAQIPSSRAGEGRRVPDQSEELQKLYEQFQRTGSTRDAERFALARLHTVIKDEHLNQ